MGSAACRGAGPERVMGPELVPLYCLAVMGANPARLWFLAWGIESREGEGAPPSLTRAAGGGSGGWFAFPGRLLERFATRLSSQVAEGLMARHSRQAAGEWLLTSPIRPPKRLMICQDWCREAGDSLPVRLSKGLMGLAALGRRGGSMACRAALRRQAARGRWPGCCR